MNERIAKERIENILNETIIEWTPSAGSNFIASTRDHSYFIKSSQNSDDSRLKEANGLKDLSHYYEHVPKVFHADQDLLIIDYIPSQEPDKNFWEQLGKNLAQMHSNKVEYFGYKENNWIGLSQQNNMTTAIAKQNPGVFFWENRISFKLNQIERTGERLVSDEQRERLKNQTIELLTYKDAFASPLHGDLWEGNVLCAQGSLPYLIDPAFYYGDRESDLAMTECFGGFSPLFYESYNKHFPLSEGYEKRKHIYNLYHMLNHFIIFGENYRRACLHIIENII